jgi:hypothetical protein
MANEEDRTYAFMVYSGKHPAEAYYKVHAKELHEADIVRVKAEAEKKAADAVRSNKARPVENGVGGSVPTTARFDLRNSTREQREEWARKGGTPWR